MSVFLAWELIRVCLAVIRGFLLPDDAQLRAPVWSLIYPLFHSSISFSKSNLFQSLKSGGNFIGIIRNTSPSALQQPQRINDNTYFYATERHKKIWLDILLYKQIYTRNNGHNIILQIAFLSFDSCTLYYLNYIASEQANIILNFYNN